jgi:hypothetical protein
MKLIHGATNYRREKKNGYKYGGMSTLTFPARCAAWKRVTAKALEEKDWWLAQLRPEVLSSHSKLHRKDQRQHGKHGHK